MNNFVQISAQVFWLAKRTGDVQKNRFNFKNTEWKYYFKSKQPIITQNVIFMSLSNVKLQVVAGPQAVALHADAFLDIPDKFVKKSVLHEDQSCQDGCCWKEGIWKEII